MLLSTNWLRDYVQHDLSPEELAHVLTMSGLEVEEGIASTGPALSGVVVGEVLEAKPHPNADRLRLCTVDLGEAGDGGPVQIVCGAPNVAAGQKVPVATVGASLPTPDGGSFTIKKAKMRGEVSQGMICAEDELGLGDDHDGILVLDANARVGQPLASYLEERDPDVFDHVLDISITPNRPDAVSHLGVARDVAALTNGFVVRPEVELPSEVQAEEGLGGVTVRIDAPEACPRYAAMRVRGVAVGESPGWLKARLEAVGLRPVNNIVDVTNFVMLEAGQPLHAFDLNEIAGDTIIVRESRAEEPFTTLDGQERKLPSGTLLICDAERAVAIAGVMGGQNSEVSGATTDVLIESAYFEPSGIRKTAKALGMQTDASYRFERGIDPTGQVWAAARAAALIAELGGGETVPGAIDANPLPYQARATQLRVGRVETLLGVAIEESEIIRLLEAIGFGVGGTGLLSITIPPFRPDVEREIDVVEEVARLYGYDRIPAPERTSLPNVVVPDPPASQLRARLRQALRGRGFHELYTNSMVRLETATQFLDVSTSGERSGAPVETLNPISQEMAALRPSLLPGALQVAAYNQSRGQASLRLFEIGHVFRKDASAGGLVPGYDEREHLLALVTGPLSPTSWNAEARDADFYDLKGIVTALLETAGIDAAKLRESADMIPSETAAYTLAVGLRKKPLGVVARLSDALAEQHDFAAPVYFAEIDLTALGEALGAPAPVRATPASRFPEVERDIAVVVPASQEIGPMLATIRKAGQPLLLGARVFDVYRGERVGEGQQSVAFALRLGADRTLKDKEIDKRVRNIVGQLERQHGATLRS